KGGSAMYDVAVVGGGIAGMATAARLQARGLATVVLEAHGQPGGCAGFFRRRGFALDVGGPPLVDFCPRGGGGAPPVPGRGGAAAGRSAAGLCRLAARSNRDAVSRRGCVAARAASGTRRHAGASAVLAMDGSPHRCLLDR